MKRAAKATVTTTTSVLLVLASAFTFGASAQASPNSEDVLLDTKTTERTVYIDTPAPQFPDEEAVLHERTADGTEMRVWEGVDFPFVPSPGETVHVVYTDSVAVVSTDQVIDANTRASCTRSLTVDPPYKASSSARVAARGMISSGCGSGKTFTLGLYGGGTLVASGSRNVINNGSVFGLNIVRACGSTTNTSYYGIAAWSDGGAVWGPTRTLACRR